MNIVCEAAMMTLKNILVATDFSEASEVALIYARELAYAFKGTLHVLHVTDNVIAEAIGVEGYTTDWATLQREVDDGARKQLDAIVTDEDRRTLAAKTIVMTSNSPAQAIVSYANDAHVDLIVLGTHGRGGMAHLFMGNVAERVVRTAPCPVLTIRQTAYTSASSEGKQTAAHV
jgi:nucleotide-binding universal stress UspA family protein